MEVAAKLLNKYGAATEVIGRRGFLGRVFFAPVAASLLPPLLCVIPDGPAKMRYWSEEWIENPNDFGKIFRLIGGYGQHYASAAVAVTDDYYANLDSRAKAIEEAKWHIRRYLSARQKGASEKEARRIAWGLNAA